MIKHGKEITVTSYYDGQPTSVKKMCEVSLFTNRDAILRDVIEALKVINNGETTKLELEICVDVKNRMRLVKKWGLK